MCEISAPKYPVDEWIRYQFVTYRKAALNVPTAFRTSAGAAIAVACLTVGLNFQKDAGRPASQYKVAFQRTDAAPANATARAGLRTSQAGTVVRLWVNNLPTGDVYEVWCDAPGWSASAGTFRVDDKGNAYVILTTAVKKGQYDKIRLVRREHTASGKVVPSDILAAKLS